MWDNLLEQDPYIKKKIATAAKAAAKAAAEAAEAKGMEKGMEKGRIEGERNSVIRVVSLRFPRLADAARQRVQHIGKADELEALMDQLLLAPDEATARRVLNPPSA